MKMQDGDEVIVGFVDGWGPERGILVDHTEDYRNVTLRTSSTRTVNGMAKWIHPAHCASAKTYIQGRA